MFQFSHLLKEALNKMEMDICGDVAFYTSKHPHLFTFPS